MARNVHDFRSTARARRQSWYGTKGLVKRALARPVPHYLLRRCVRLAGERFHYERLPAPAALDRVNAHMSGVDFTMLRPDRCIVAKELYWGGGQRPVPADQLALDVFGTLAREARLVFDVGAYTGIFSLLAARVSPGAEVHAFEVVPDVAAAAVENVAANDLGEAITVHAEGVGRDGDSVRIGTGASGSALPDFYSTGMYFDDGVDVPVRSLDTIMESIDADTDPGRAVVKIDVEGTEDVVLGNGPVFLKLLHPDIVCEILPGVANVSALREILDHHGYRYFRIEDTALTEHAGPVPSPIYRDWLLTNRTDDELADLPVA
jgi:FkbM family methyltransferase